MKPIAQVIPGVLAEIVRAAPMSHGKIDFAWHTAVGAAMARSSAVRLENGVLLVEAQTAQWAAAIMRASPMILSRLRSALGPDVVREIRLRR
jgi:predicted nucleic acid-binding Zn ribbon protein